jgi:hypothetical protein
MFTILTIRIFLSMPYISIHEHTPLPVLELNERTKAHGSLFTLFRRMRCSLRHYRGIEVIGTGVQNERARDRAACPRKKGDYSLDPSDDVKQHSYSPQRFCFDDGVGGTAIACATPLN